MGVLGWTAFFAWRRTRGREDALESILNDVETAGPFCCYCCNFCGDCWQPEDFCGDCFG